MTQKSESVREAEQREVNPELAVYVFSHDKHYRALIRWMKRKKMNAYDLCDLFAEGSTVAHQIWKLYDEEGWPNHSEKYDQQRIKAATLKLAEEAERELGSTLDEAFRHWAACDEKGEECGDWQAREAVAAWLREKAR